MPPKETEFEPLYCVVNGVKLLECPPQFEFLPDVNPIETAELEDSYSRIGGKSFEGTISVDTEAVARIQEAIKPKHGEKITVKVSSPPCDSTLSFLLDLFAQLKRMGCVISDFKIEELDNPKDKRYATVFTAWGYYYNTNNWRKMHGVPMKRRVHNGKSKAKAQTVTA